jgi:hypothetical protein
VLAALATVVLAVPTLAAPYEEARDAAQLSPDPLLRSPRMLGFGRLEWVIDDHHNRFTMWDFAGNPTGVYDADSGSTLEVRPRTGSNSSVRDVSGTRGTLERQTLAARDIGLGFEAWRRAAGTTAYGLTGELRSIRLDRPYTDDVEVRRNVSVPDLQGIATGPMPYVFTQRMRYALRLVYGTESVSDEYRAVVTDAAGQWIDRDGELLATPILFTPDVSTSNHFGGGVAVAYDFGRPLRLAVGYDLVETEIEGENSGDRYSSSTKEKRPYHNGQVSLIGRLGPHLEYGADARGWRASSEQTWLFTISAGIGADPLTGRGKLLERDEEGSRLRARARWSQGPLEVGGGLGTAYRQVEITAPGADDPTSLNRFMNTAVYYRQNADTLALPDSVRNSLAEERAWEAGGGIAWKRLPWNARFGSEFHAWRWVRDHALAGQGPKRVGWELRNGLEVPVNAVVTLRGGYIHRWQDEDDLTRGNEFVSHSATLGLGLRPVGARWALDAGYVVDWARADFGDPGLPRSGRQILASQVRWTF